MKKFILPLSLILVLVSCTGKKETGKKLEVKGVITNNPAKMIYLEELPMTTMQRALVDSSVIGKDGSFSLHSTMGEARVYNLRLDQNVYPLAALINDASPITVNAKFSTENKQFAESYEVTGSPASQEMKDFMGAFNNRLQGIFVNSVKADSLRKIKNSDSAVQALEQNIVQLSAELKSLALQSLEKSNNPALSMFILGYYQSIANNPAYRLEAMEKAEVTQIVNNVAAKFPDHPGVKAIQATLQGWVGQQAPEISLPDPTGKEVKLSSFRGKYVLVDFWASWCGPCRAENPNVVKAFNKFKDKNFTILGVSLDRPGQKDQWMNAVMKDNLTWTQVSDLLYWDSPVVALYKIDGIPFNVLVDPNGKIIAESLRGEELEKKLEEVLK